MTPENLHSLIATVPVVAVFLGIAVYLFSATGKRLLPPSVGRCAVIMGPLAVACTLSVALNPAWQSSLLTRYLTIAFMTSVLVFASAIGRYMYLLHRRNQRRMRAAPAQHAVTLGHP